MNQITTQQHEMVGEFAAVTNETDEEAIIQILRDHNWKLEASIADYLNGNLQSTVTRNNNQQQPVGWLSWFWNSGLSALEYVIPAPAAELDPVTASNRLITELTQKYGNVHPRIITGTFQNACSQSKNEFKFLIVYLHSPMHQNTAQFCRNVLCTSTISDFFDDNFLFWAGSITNGDTFKVSNLLGASTYPFLAVLCNNNLNGSSMTLMDRIEGPISQDDLLARLASVLETSGPFLHAAQTEQEERNMDRRIREEQDEAFLRSLEEDQERERRKKEEEEMQKREMEREKQEMAEMEKKIEDRKHKKALALSRLPKEPLPGDKFTTHLVIRHVDGSRLQRRFNASDKLQTVFDFVESQPIDLDHFEILQNIPRKVFSDGNMTLEDAGLVPQAALFVQEKIQD